MAYECVGLMGNQLLDMAASEGTGTFGAIGKARSGAGGRAMPAVHRSAGALAAEAFPEGHPLPGEEGHTHAHRSDFSLMRFPVTLLPDFALGAGSCSTDRGSGIGRMAAARPAPRTFALLLGSGCEAAAEQLYVYRWNRQGRKGQRCRLLARGTMNSCLLVFGDGYTMVSSRNALMKEKRTPSALRAPGDFSGAGALALVRAPALPRGMRAALPTEQDE